MLSVAFRVNTISRVEPALTNARTRFAALLVEARRPLAQRVDAAVDIRVVVSRSTRTIASMTDLGFCVVAALSR